jgi:hypothetical protein
LLITTHKNVASNVKKLYPCLEMALVTALRQFNLLPGLIQNGNGEPPRKAHFLGKDKATPLDRRQQETGGNRDDEPKKQKSGSYRGLDTITIGDVDDVYQYFRNQLVSSSNEGWIAKNYFCSLPLKRKGDGRPSAVFGRVKTCYPLEGHVLNVEEMELDFPQKAGKPDILHLFNDDIAVNKPVYSYCVEVKCFVSAQEKDDFSLSENTFAGRGFTPRYSNDMRELFEMNEQNQNVLSWLYVIGSEWLASIPPSMQRSVRERLKDLVHWNKVVLNYHPRRYSLQYRSLNEELDFNYGFSDRAVLTPQTPEQVLQKVQDGLSEILMRGMV